MLEACYEERNASNWKEEIKTSINNARFEQMIVTESIKMLGACILLAKLG